MDPGRRMPPMMDPSSIVLPASVRSGWTTSVAKFVATPAPSNVSLDHFRPRMPVVIDPPETDEMRASFFRYPNSFNRHNAPR
jgi:hypothetical protein